PPRAHGCPALTALRAAARAGAEAEGWPRRRADLGQAHDRGRGRPWTRAGIRAATATRRAVSPARPRHAGAPGEPAPAPVPALVRVPAPALGPVPALTRPSPRPRAGRRA